jgi:ubiquitin C-terminal hydrolase
MLTKQKQDQHFKNYVICKTEDTRNVAYNIVASLHKVSPAIEPLYFNNYILPIIKNIGQDIRLTASKSSDVGLKNFGSTCYMNSMLQVINSVGPFRNSLMKC